MVGIPLETELVLTGRSTNGLLVGLVLLLGVQLTGLTCLGEWQTGSTASLIATADLPPSPDGTVTDDGCPCHFVFQSVPLAASDIMHQLADDTIVSSTLYVPTFVVFLFRPPALA